MITVFSIGFAIVVVVVPFIIALSATYDDGQIKISDLFVYAFICATAVISLGMSIERYDRELCVLRHQLTAAQCGYNMTEDHARKLCNNRENRTK